MYLTQSLGDSSSRKVSIRKPKEQTYRILIRTIMLTGKEAQLCDCSGFEIRPGPNSALPLIALWLVTNNLMSLSLSFQLCTNGDNCPYK